MPVPEVSSLVLTLRGKRVLLDSDLARLTSRGEVGVRQNMRMAVQTMDPVRLLWPGTVEHFFPNRPQDRRVGQATGDVFVAGQPAGTHRRRTYPGTVR
jgi:hypothetical protein